MTRSTSTRTKGKTSKAKTEDNPLRKASASVIVERNGAVIRFDNVPPDDAATVLEATLLAFRILTKHYPELIPDLTPVGGGTPIDVTDDEWSEEGTRKKHRVGF